MVVVEMDSIIFRRNTRKGGRCMRGGRSIQGQIINTQKSIQTLSSQITNPIYRRNIKKIGNSLFREKTKLESLIKKKNAANLAAVEAKIAANRATASPNTGILSKITNTVQSAVQAVVPASSTANANREAAAKANANREAAAAKANANREAAAKANANREAAAAKANANREAAAAKANANREAAATANREAAAKAAKVEQVRSLVGEARELAQKLTAAANAINATSQGGKHRNRRTRRR